MHAVDVGAHVQLAGRLLGNQHVVTRDHLHLHTQGEGDADGLRGVITGRVKEGQHTLQLPLTLIVGDGHSHRSVATVGQANHALITLGTVFLGVGAHVQQHLGSTLGHTELATVRLLDGGLRAFVGGVERHKRQLLVLLQRFLVTGVHDDGVNGITLSHGASHLGGQSTNHEQLISTELIEQDGVVQHQFVLGEGARLVGAQHGHTSQLLNGGQAGYNGTLLSKTTTAYSQSGGTDDLHGDGDGCHQ